MPLHDFRCGTCDRVFEAVVAVDVLPAGPPCPSCTSSTERIWLPPLVRRATPDAVVVYRAPDGSFRFPGDTTGLSTSKYDAMGYERIEARGFAEVRQLESRLNASERSRMARIHERTCERREHADSLRSAELRRVMQQHMTEAGRAFARSVLDQRDAIRRARQTRGSASTESSSRREPGVHIEAYSMDRTNRESSRDAQGRRRPD